MFRKFILYLTGFCFALLLLSFSGCQSEKSSTYSSVSMEESSVEALSQETPAQPVSETELSSLEETTHTVLETTLDEAITTQTSDEEQTKFIEQETSSEATPLPEINAETLINCSTTLYTYDQMEADLHTLAAAYPDILQVTTVSNADGTAILTADDRPMYVAYFGNRNASQQIFICAATHAREYMTTQLVMRQLAHTCATYETGSYNSLSYREIFDRTCFVIVPMVNPDGVSISQLGLAGLRFSRMGYLKRPPGSFFLPVRRQRTFLGTGNSGSHPPCGIPAQPGTSHQLPLLRGPGLLAVRTAGAAVERQ